MQESEPPSNWPKRLLFAGIGLMLVGTILFFSLSENVNEKIDPRHTSEFTASYGEDNVFQLKNGCWVVSSIDADSEDLEISFNLIENSTISEKPVKTDCKEDFQPQSTDGTIFKVHDTIDSSNQSIQIVIDCTKEEDECENIEIYLTHNSDAVFGWLNDWPLIISGLFCCFGIILIPFGGMLMMIEKGRVSQVNLEQPGNLSDLEVNNLQNPILSTDEIYRLMKGEVTEEGVINQVKKPDVSSPFSDVDTRQKVTSPKGGSINSPSNYTHANPPKDDAWKKWDES